MWIEIPGQDLINLDAVARLSLAGDYLCVTFIGQAEPEIRLPSKWFKPIAAALRGSGSVVRHPSKKVDVLWASLKRLSDEELPHEPLPHPYLPPITEM